MARSTTFRYRQLPRIHLDHIRLNVPNARRYASRPHRPQARVDARVCVGTRRRLALRFHFLISQHYLNRFTRAPYLKQCSSACLAPKLTLSIAQRVVL